MPTRLEIQVDRIIIDHMAQINPITQLVSHDYISDIIGIMNVGRRPAGEFALGERWYFEHHGETAQNICWKVCVKHARKYVYFARSLADGAFANRITKVDKTKLIGYSLGQPMVFAQRRPGAPGAGSVEVPPAPVAPAAPAVAQPTSDTCSVCLTDYDLKDMAETVCRHNFCDACAMKLYRTGVTACPMCRTALQFKIGARV